MKVNVQGQRDSLTVNSIFNPALSLALALFEIESGSQNNLRPDAGIGKNFQKNRMRNAAVDKLHFFYSALNRRDGARPHAGNARSEIARAGRALQ